MSKSCIKDIDVVSVFRIADYMLGLFRQCGILLFVSVSVISVWMLEVFRQCGSCLVFHVIL